MHRSARTVTSGARTRSPVAAVLAAVVLAVLATFGIAGPPPGTSGAMAGAPAAADHHRYDGTRADDGCDAACVVRAATRLEPHGEHPAPRGHLGICGDSADAGACRVPGPYRDPIRLVPSAQPHTAQDQGRAPPVFSGT
ncbi:hypothetical protein [Streptomyces sp. NPDC093598]|uniref:hypothetical protein n=1 Tax=Streptomyces sp. NPDC093598 TaxID=3366046 RepID=UPI003808ED30